MLSMSFLLSTDLQFIRFRIRLWKLSGPLCTCQLRDLVGEALRRALLLCGCCCCRSG